MDDMRSNSRGTATHLSRSTLEPTGGGSKMKWVVTAIVVILVIVAIGGCGWWWRMHHNNDAKTVNSKEYQAVFLTNSQVYFGKIKTITSNTIELDNIYYLTPNQASQNGTSSTAQNTQLTLVKLGSEIHAPEDSMLIDRHQVLFWENLKDSGKVAQAIKQNQGK